MQTRRLSSKKEIIYEVKIKEAIAYEHKCFKKYALFLTVIGQKKEVKHGEKRLSDAKRNSKQLKIKWIEDISKKAYYLKSDKKAISNLSKYFEIETEENGDNVEKFTWKFKDEIQKKLKKMTDIMFLFVQNRRVRSWKFILRLNIDVRLKQ